MSVQHPDMATQGSSDPARLLEDLKRKLGWATSWGIEGRIIDPDECEKQWPMLNSSMVLGGLHVPSDGLASAARAVQLLIERASAAGVRFLGETPVTGIERSGRRVTGVRTPRGDIAAGTVINCTAGWSTIISEMAGELKDGGFEIEFEAALEDLIERVAVMRL